MARINAVPDYVKFCSDFLSDVQKGGNGGSGRKGGRVVLRTASAEFIDRRRNLKTTSLY